MRIESTALSGMLAAQARLNQSAHNVANVNTPGFQPGRVVLRERGTGGVDARTEQPTQAAVEMRQQTQRADDARGEATRGEQRRVESRAVERNAEQARSQVSLEQEMVEQRSAAAMYSANARMVRTASEMQGRLLDVMA